MADGKDLVGNIVFYNSCEYATWMVILNGGRGVPVFLSDDDGYCLLFDNSGDAMEAGLGNRLGATRGFIVVPWEHKE
jgi:hypothetical protein